MVALINAILRFQRELLADLLIAAGVVLLQQGLLPAQLRWERLLAFLIIMVVEPFRAALFPTQ